MPVDYNPRFDAAVTALTRTTQQRVWSMLVTIFGDLAQQPGDSISSAVLSRITEPAGIRPEAMRVALHRLRRDGWIESTRIGRSSQHRLSETGRAESARVTPRIYARVISLPDQWHLKISETPDPEGSNSAAQNGHVQIAPNAVLAPGPLPVATAHLGIELTAYSVPPRLHARLCPPDLLTACRDLHQALQMALENLTPNTTLSALQIATLRLLIVHNWRRILLRHPDLPSDFFPPEWTGPACRELVWQMLSCLPRPGLADLETDAALSV